MASKTTWRRAILVVPLLVAVVVMALGAVLWAVQRRLIYFPDARAPSTALLESGWEEVAYPTDDGLTLRGWYRAPRPERAVVLVFGGNAGNRADRMSLGSALASGDVGVFLTDYRGYGGNPGHPSEHGLAVDAQAALGFLRDRVHENQLIYFEESLGAAVAIELAVSHPPAALILRSPFTSMVAVGRAHYPWLPVGGLLKDRYPSIERIGSLSAPTLVIAGDHDSIVPVGQSRQIYDAAPDPKQWLVIPGADHNDPALVGGPDMVGALLRFIAETGSSPTN